MSLRTSDINRFWQNIDQRGEVAPGTSEAIVGTPLITWGIAGTTLATPQPHLRFVVHAPLYVVGWSMVANQSGDAVVSVERSVFGTTGLTFTSVTGGADPTLSSAQAIRETNLSTWTPRLWAITDIIHIYLSSVSTVEELTFQLLTRHMRRVGA